MGFFYCSKLSRSSIAHTYCISKSNAQKTAKHSPTYDLISKGELSRAYQNLQSSATVAALTADTLEKLVKLQPPRHQPDSHVMHEQIPPGTRSAHTISGAAAFSLVRKSRALVAPVNVYLSFLYTMKILHTVT